MGLRLLMSRRHEGLSLTGLRVILDHAEIIHEGDVCHDTDGSHYFGSTMFTLDVDQIAEHIVGPPDGRTCEKLLDHLRAHPFFRVHLMRLSRREVLRRVGSLPLLPLSGEMRARVQDRKLYVDLDVEFHGLTSPLSAPV
jgi:hypothetical protein